MEAADSIQLFSRPPKRRKAPKLHHGEAKEQPSIAAAAQAAHEQADLQQQQPQAADPPLPDRAQAGASSSSAPVDLSDLQATSFKDLGVSDWLCSVLKTLGITTPTQVQAGCIPAIMAGRDVIGLAQTGSGKTAAFALPILQRLAQDPYGIYALVLTPTRCGATLPASSCCLARIIKCMRMGRTPCSSGQMYHLTSVSLVAVMASAVPGMQAAAHHPDSSRPALLPLLRDASEHILQFACTPHLQPCIPVSLPTPS
jgi:predicted flap endonuclease-1-like 5' DNA nuclease